MRFADTHCHLDFPRFDQSRAEVLAACLDSSIELIVVPAVKACTWSSVLAIAREFEEVRPALGLHPYFIAEHCESHLEELDHQLNRVGSSVCALGEIGLDATISDIDRQSFFFERQLELAAQYQYPVIIHSRKTHGRIVKTVKRYRLAGGVVHAFSGSYQEAMSLVSAGLAIGVGGVITWPRALKTRNAVSRLPVGSLVLETDAPDMPVFGHAKGSGTPLDLLRIFESLCDVRKESPGELASTLWDNSQRLFGD